MEKELRLISKLKNNRLIKARESMGFASVAALCAVSQLSNTEVGRYENLKKNPINKKTGDFKISAQRLADFLLQDANYLWPETLHEIENSQLEKELDIKELKELQTQRDPDLGLLRNEINLVLQRMPSREALIIRRRFGLADNGESVEGETLKEIGEDLAIGGERVSQIEERALRRLRHPTFSKFLSRLSDA